MADGEVKAMKTSFWIVKGRKPLFKTQQLTALTVLRYMANLKAMEADGSIVRHSQVGRVSIWVVYEIACSASR